MVVFALLNALALDWRVLKSNLAPEGFPLTIYRLSIIVFGVYWLVDLVNFFFTAFEVAPLYDVFYLSEVKSPQQLFVEIQIAHGVRGIIATVLKAISLVLLAIFVA